ncbi:hypothetical protein SM084_004111 [Cronobacter sakazakii]|uniref:hypothetical protein n=1 Tax=Cronobacter sakazakii TaxID=28141 RepID=UPI000CFD7E6A|nr:hypothetical protein [Cronobacter sakazakii]EGT4949775.1 hypothetical protein [Cronobacter sakazakii]EKK3995786.1 hypothetical protein [Cronobacter sakazakii]ELY2475624.1 hypothetical protein [Cronobacter sakazakii]ELY4716289.1 hypothetical protein [Cronobacter sakazakii]ELY4736533.1 hypothetical protein [Cronobacter sakazakii]
MATVQNFSDGFSHLPHDARTTLETLCGVCDDKENRAVSEQYEGEITCPVCRGAARLIFNSCKKSEVKK